MVLLLTACTAPAPTTPPAPPAAPPAPRFNPSYQTTPAPMRIDASARVEATVAIEPQLRPLWETWLGDSVDAYLAAMTATLKADIVNSGLFARIEQVEAAQADYLVRIQAVESDPANLRLKVTIQLVDLTTEAELFTRSAELALGLTAARNNSISFSQTPKYAPDLNGGWSGSRLLTGSMQLGFEQAMPVMKAGVAGYFQKIADGKTLENMKTASLPELTTGTDRTVSLARERNRLIIIAKNQQLPSLLRDMANGELSDFATKLELAILDLGHESEVAKERAQSSPGQGDELRSLAISYRERIELLKPILAAIQEKLARK